MVLLCKLAVLLRFLVFNRGELEKDNAVWFGRLYLHQIWNVEKDHVAIKYEHGQVSMHERECHFRLDPRECVVIGFGLGLALGMFEIRCAHRFRVRNAVFDKCRSFAQLQGLIIHAFNQQSIHETLAVFEVL